MKAEKYNELMKSLTLSDEQKNRIAERVKESYVSADNSEKTAIPFRMRIQRRPLLRICTVLALVTVVIGIGILQKNGGSIRPQPVIIAYASDASNDYATATRLKMGDKVPVSMFETSSGLQGFVISYNKPDENAPSSTAIFSTGNDRGYFKEIYGIATDSTQNYWFFIPGENEEAPYTFPFFFEDTEKSLIFKYELVVTQMDGDFYMELTNEEVIKNRLLQENGD